MYAKLSTIPEKNSLLHSRYIACSVFEASPKTGGHANTIDVAGVSVDTGENVFSMFVYFL